MKFFKALLALPILAVSAAPTSSWSDDCLTDGDAQYIVDQSIVFLLHNDIAAAKAAAYSIFTDDIVEFGDSINSLRGDPLGTQVEDGIERYVNETTSQPSYKSIDTLDIIHDCRSILWQWRFDLGLPTGPMNRIQGITIIKTNSAKKVYYQYVEFNSLAWAEDVGFTVIPPSS